MQSGMREEMREGGRTAVVILNWNGAAHLREFMPSVVAHTPTWVDIVVADNGSSDESCEVIEEEFSPRVSLLRLDRNWGFAEGYNRALARLDHDIFILLNSDVEVSQGWCEPLVEELILGDDIGVVGSKIRSYRDREMFEYAGAAGGYIDYLGYPFCRGRELSALERDEGQYDDARDLFWVSGAALACRADLFRRLDGFCPEFFAHQEEIDFCWRVQLSGYRVRVVPRSVVYHLGGGTLGEGSPEKVRLNHRNNLAMIYRCAPPAQRIVVALLRPLLDLLAAVVYLLKGDGRSSSAVVRAWCEFIMWHKRLSTERRVIRRSRVAESRYIYRGLILWRSLLGKSPTPPQA